MSIAPIGDLRTSETKKQKNRKSATKEIPTQKIKTKPTEKHEGGGNLKIKAQTFTIDKSAKFGGNGVLFHVSKLKHPTLLEEGLGWDVR